MILDDETIAAVSTPFGEGAIALVRITGPASRQVLDTVFCCQKGSSHMQQRRQYLGVVRNHSGEEVDEVLVTRFCGPSSYTGEDLVEISCHGGIHVTRRVLDAVLAAGARHAEPGEFTQRAFVNGRMDLTQAEAVIDLIRARSDLALVSARAQLSGSLGRGVEEMRQQLLKVLAHLEAYIDFPEEDIEVEVGRAMIERMSAARDEVMRLLGTAERGRILREGIATVICGAPNVGKSSLLNALAGRDRAIVSEVAGTTRDTVEELIHVGGFALRLIDTAGVRESEDAVEREGISRTRRALEEADLVIEVVDASCASEQQQRVAMDKRSGAALLVVLNKIDLGEHPDWSDCRHVRVSCVEQTGLELLADCISELAGSNGMGVGQDPVSINARHHGCLRRAREALDAAIRGLEEGAYAELVAIDLREALDAIGAIVGKVDTEDLLGEIFANFCIGK